MAYRITLVDDIAKLGNWQGTRRRTCTFADGHKETLVFGRRPVVLAELPPEVKNDPKLEVEEIAATAPAPERKGDRVQRGESDTAAPPPADPEATDLENLDVPALVALAKQVGVPSLGNAAQLRKRIAAAMAAPAAAEAAGGEAPEE